MRVHPADLVLWRDDSILVVNKPSGLATIPGGFDPGAPHLRGLLEDEFGPLWIVHRLDKETSGALLLARTAYAHRALNLQFEQRHVEKIYHALVVGQPEWQEEVASMRLRSNADRRHRTRVDQRRGKEALTELRVLERFRNHALLEAIPRTGRSHQIRSHLAALGFPIVGDELYGGGTGILEQELPERRRNSRREESWYPEHEQSPRPLLDRTALHAHSLHFEHPLSGETMQVRAPYPSDLDRTIRRLRRA